MLSPITSSITAASSVPHFYVLYLCFSRYFCEIQSKVCIENSNIANCILNVELWDKKSMPFDIFSSSKHKILQIKNAQQKVQRQRLNL